MKTARFHGREDVRIAQIDPDSVGPDDVRIDVAACGICGSDLQEYRVGPRHTPTNPHPETGASLPITMGHEFSGVVNEVGGNVTRVREGDPVIVNPNIPCRACQYCEDGMYNVCPNTVAVGFQTGAGGFAEQAVVPVQQVHHLPDSVPVENGSLVEPLSVGLHAVRRADLQAGDTVAVFGCGPIGLTVVHAARTAGAKQVLVSEPNQTRREVAVELGADICIDPTEGDAVEKIRAETGGGVDIAFEFAGVDATVAAAIESTRRKGTITIGSMTDAPIATDYNKIVTAERTVIGTYCYGFPPQSSRTEFDAVIRSLAAGAIDAEAFVTDRIDLENVVESGFEELNETDTDHVKILVVP